MQLGLFQPQHPEMTEKEKVSMSLSDLSYNIDRLKDVFNSLNTLLQHDLLTTIECQLKADRAIDDFMTYVNSGGQQ